MKKVYKNKLKPDYANQVKHESNMTIKIIGIIIAVLIGIILLAGGAKAGLEKSEKAECAKWQYQSDNYPAYYYTDWQVEQCEANGIELK